MTRKIAYGVVLIGLFVAACDTIKKLPGYCASDAECPGSTCDLIGHGCVPVGGDAGTADGGNDAGTKCTATSCEAAAPVCGSDGVCRACNGSGDDSACGMRSASTPRCKASGTNAGQCVACATSADCTTASAPVCGDDGSCRACAAHSECSSGICVQDGASAGQCAPTSMVALVDNAGMNPPAGCRATQDGTMWSTAYCDVMGAVMATSPKPYVLVKGSTVPYSAVTLTDRSMTIVGPGKTATPTARLFTVANNAVLVTVTSMATVILDGLDLGGDVNQSATYGLMVGNSAAMTTAAMVVLRNARVHDCSQDGVSGGRGTVTVSGSTITGSGGAGVSASGGTVTLAQDFVEHNQGGGVSLSTSDYSLENVVLDNNGQGDPGGSGFGGLSINGHGPNNLAQVVNVTIADNNSTAGAYSGIDCTSAAMPIIFNTVVAASNGGTQLNPACKLASSAYPGGSMNNDIDITSCTDTQLFVAMLPNYYQPLVTAMPSCALIGKGAATYKSVTAPSVDILGAMRPATPAIGAYE